MELQGINKKTKEINQGFIGTSLELD